MTKLKNTKKGMAKKALSISLVAAMLATSNVPVWAAEDLFTDGSSAAVEAPSAEVDTFSATPVEEVPTDAPALNANDYQANLSSNSVNVSGDITASFTGVVVGSGEETNKYSVNWYVVDDGVEIKENMTNSNVDAIVSKTIGYTNSFSQGAITDNLKGKSGKLENSDVGKKLAVVLYENKSGTWTTITDAAYAEIKYDSADTYVTKKTASVQWGSTLEAKKYANAVVSGFSAKEDSYKWTCNGAPVADGYKTTNDDMGNVYTLTAEIVDDSNGKSVGRATLAEITVSIQSATVYSVTWEDDVKTDNAGNPVYTYDGTAHYPKLKSVILTNGETIDASNATYTQLTVDQATNANTGITYSATIATEKYGKISVNKKLYINPVNLNTEGSLTVSNGFEYNKKGSYTIRTTNADEDLAKAGMSVKVGEKVLTYGTDYTAVIIASPANEVGQNALVTVTGNGNYKGILTVQASITAKELKEDNVTLDQDEFPYDGNAVEPKVTVIVDGSTLEKDKDYTVSYSNNKEVGTGTVTVTGIGNYTGTVDKTFKIESASLSELMSYVRKDFADASKRTYTGKPIDLVQDAYAGLKYVKNRDFTVEYEPQNTNAGKVMLKLHGINNYAGAKTEEYQFEILARSLNDKDVKVSIEGLTYDKDLTDAEIKKAITITYNGMTLVENTDYEVSAISKDGNKVTLTLKGLGNYKDTRIATVKMTEKDINTVTLPKIDAQSYTGDSFVLAKNSDGTAYLKSDGKKVADFAIKDGDTTLKLDEDYKVVNYENNKNVGTATINIVGMGAYKGTASISFPIVDQKLTGSIITKDGSPIIPDQQYSYAKVTAYGGFKFADGELKVVDQNGDTISSDRYTMTYKDNTAAGTATITVEGKDGFDLYAVNTFKIVPAKITDSKIVRNNKFDFSDTDVKYYYTGEEIKPSMDVDLRDGSYKLVEGTDYELVYSENINVTDKAKVKVVGLGNYAGTVTDTELTTAKLVKDFAINKTSIRPTDVAAADVAYAGGLPVEPQITVTNRYSGKALVKDTDYTVEITKGGINIGQVTAKIALTESAKKNYQYEKTSGSFLTEWEVNFNVKAQDLANVEISEIADQVATGEQIKPAIVVMNGQARMVEGYDYEVSYGENTEVGTGTVKITPVEGSKTYTGSQEVTFNIVEEAPEVGQAVISNVRVSGNTVTPILSGDVDGAVGYDYVISTSADVTDAESRVDISKNILKTNTNFYYVGEGSYYVYCHAWKRDENGIKVFGEWSNVMEVEVTATTPEKPTITSARLNGRNLTVTWTKSDNATGYDIVMGKAARKVNGELRPVDYGKAVKKITNGNTVTVTFRSIPKGTYYVGLHAYNRTSETGVKVFSPWSGARKVVVR